MTTKIADIIQPAVFNPYVQVKTKELSALIQSGIAVADPEFSANASGPNTLIHMPYFNDLDGDSEGMDDDGQLTPGKITTSQDQARKHLRARAWGVNALSAHLSGADPMAAIGNSVAQYWVREQQKILVNSLKGVFASTSMSDLILDVSNNGGSSELVSGAAAVDAIQLLGDAKDNVTAVMMHSAVEAWLVKQQLITYVDTVNELSQSVRIPYFMNKRVIVDDAMAYDTTTEKVELYFFGAGALAYGEGHDPKIVETEIARDALQFAGEDYLINRKLWILHPRGIKWTNASVAKTTPSFDEMADGANWERVYDKKQIRIVKLIAKIG